MNKNISAISNFDGIFTDAFVCNHESVAFVSLWGRSSRIMALYGAITTGSLDTLVIDSSRWGISKELDKKQMRMPKNSRYGADCMHVMLFAELVVKEKGGKRILVDLQAINDDRLWDTLISMSELALLPHWREPLLQKLIANGFIADLPAKKLVARLVNLSDNDGYEALVQSMIRSGELSREAA